MTARFFPRCFESRGWEEDSRVSSGPCLFLRRKKCALWLQCDYSGCVIPSAILAKEDWGKQGNESNGRLAEAGGGSAMWWGSLWTSRAHPESVPCSIPLSQQTAW